VTSRQLLGVPAPFWILLLVMTLVAVAAVVVAATRAAGTDGASDTSGATVIGTTETVRIVGPGGESAEVDARIDTGATGSSIDDDLAEDLGFDLENADTVKVSSSLGTEERPVVEGTIRIAGQLKEARLNVTDREQRATQVLIGRRDLVGLQIDVRPDAD